jgi:cytochrome b561
MKLLNSSARYGAITQSLHWSVVLLVLLAWGLGVVGDEVPKGTGEAAVLFAHMSAGLLVVLLTMMRLLWRLADPSPQPESTEFGNFAFAG